MPSCRLCVCVCVCVSVCLSVVTFVHSVKTNKQSYTGGEAKVPRSENSKNFRSLGTKVPRERKFSLWTFRSPERKCSGTKIPSFEVLQWVFQRTHAWTHAIILTNIKPRPVTHANFAKTHIEISHVPAPQQTPVQCKTSPHSCSLRTFTKQNTRIGLYTRIQSRYVAIPLTL